MRGKGTKVTEKHTVMKTAFKSTFTDKEVKRSAKTLYEITSKKNEKKGSLKKYGTLRSLGSVDFPCVRIENWLFYDKNLLHFHSFCTNNENLALLNVVRRARYDVAVASRVIFLNRQFHHA